ncbi:MAG: winged helix-turn-helix transcriptional regulator [Candidatus Aminicenantes bacterium]|nr:winged helix-turn-helix transcriptional regulator [Candidatus Aminicenantes bacterium]
MENEFKDESDLLKAISHPVRLKIIDLLLLRLPIEVCSVNTLQQKLDIPQPTISQHLQILKNHGIIQGSKSGVQVCYKVIDDRVIKIIELLKNK